eukprot:m.118463 g.118463  ORF g.118463 m.118463 type:complete len:701 (-) comp15564_c0_seq1:145-2247(-)
MLTTPSIAAFMVIALTVATSVQSSATVNNASTCQQRNASSTDADQELPVVHADITMTEEEHRELVRRVGGTWVSPANSEAAWSQLDPINLATIHPAIKKSCKDVCKKDWPKNEATAIVREIPKGVCKQCVGFLIESLGVNHHMGVVDNETAGVTHTYNFILDIPSIASLLPSYGGTGQWAVLFDPSLPLPDDLSKCGREKCRAFQQHPDGSYSMEMTYQGPALVINIHGKHGGGKTLFCGLLVGISLANSSVHHTLGISGLYAPPLPGSGGPGLWALDSAGTGMPCNNTPEALRDRTATDNFVRAVIKNVSHVDIRLINALTRDDQRSIVADLEASSKLVRRGIPAPLHILVHNYKEATTKTLLQAARKMDMEQFPGHQQQANKYRYASPGLNGVALSHYFLMSEHTEEGKRWNAATVLALRQELASVNVLDSPANGIMTKLVEASSNLLNKIYLQDRGTLVENTTKTNQTQCESGQAATPDVTMAAEDNDQSVMSWVASQVRRLMSGSKFETKAATVQNDQSGGASLASDARANFDLTFVASNAPGQMPALYFKPQNTNSVILINEWLQITTTGSSFDASLVNLPRYTARTYDAVGKASPQHRMDVEMDLFGVRDLNCRMGSSGQGLRITGQPVEPVSINTSVWKLVKTDSTFPAGFAKFDFFIPFEYYPDHNSVAAMEKACSTVDHHGHLNFTLMSNM